MEKCLIMDLQARQKALYYNVRNVLCRKRNINNTAFDIIMFLANHPNNNTAKDICTMRGIKTGIMSVEVEKLVQEKILVRETDQNDRRKQRLTLTKLADPIVVEGKKLQQAFWRKLVRDLSQDEIKIYSEISQKMANTVEELEKELEKDIRGGKIEY